MTDRKAIKIPAGMKSLNWGRTVPPQIQNNLKRIHATENKTLGK